MDRDHVLAQRLATQRLTGTPASGPMDAVRDLLAVQAQDAPLARIAVAQRTATGPDAVRAALDSGQLVRTHVLRPTWHLVTADDLPWLLDLTSDKVVSGLRGRHEQLSLDDRTVANAFDAFAATLAGRTATRAELAGALRADGVLGECLQVNQQVGHLLLLAELRGVIASGPLADGPASGEHTYALVPERRSEVRPRAEGVRALVGRFFASHGPASVADLQRWTRLGRSEIADALAALPDIAAVEVDGVVLHYSPDLAAARPPGPREGAFLLSTFDEAFLSYRDVPFPRVGGHPAGDGPYRFAEAGGGPVVCDLLDVGGWKRTRPKGRPVLDVTLAPGLSRAQRVRVEAAADTMAALLAEPDEASPPPVRYTNGPLLRP